MNSARKIWTDARAGDSFSATLDDAGMTLVLQPPGEPAQAVSMEPQKLIEAGPVLASPADSITLGEWLYQLLQDPPVSSSWKAFDTNGNLWRIDTEGAAASLYLEQAECRSALSMFRHDVRNVLNGIGMNADLIAMQASTSGNEPTTEAARRIQSGLNRLRELIGPRSGNTDTAAMNLATELKAALARVNINVTLSNAGNTVESVSPEHLAAMVRLMNDWLLWNFCAGRNGSGDDSGYRANAELAIRNRQAVLELRIDPADSEDRGASGSHDSSQSFRCGPAELESMTMLRDVGAGFGMWRERNKVGLCIGLSHL